MINYLLDRDKEISDVMSIIDENKDQKIILLVTGVSGVGKSGFVEKLTQNNVFNNAILSVKISKHSIDTIENLQYFNALYKAMTKYAKSKLFDKVVSPTLQGIKKPKNIIRFVLNIIKSKLGIDNGNVFSEPEEEESVVRKKDYLLHILQKNNIITNIDNIQNIDTQSFELLKEIINDCPPRTFIFEYTLDKNNLENYKNFYKELSETNATVCPFKIEKMDFVIAKKLAPQKVLFNEEKLRILYDRSKGNLMEIILADENIEEDLSNIEIRLNQLTKNERFILYIIFLYYYPIMYEELLTIIFNNNSNNFILGNKEIIDSINFLCNRNILIKKNNYLQIKHDSIIEKLEYNKHDPVMYIAYSSLKEYYSNIECNKYDIIEKQIVLYLKFSDQELLKLLPKVKMLILNMKYPQLIIEKLKYYRNELIHNAHFGFEGTYSLTLMLVEICLSKKMWQEAQNNLNLIYDQFNIYHVALQAQIYSLQENMNAHNSLCDLVNTTPVNSRLRLITEIHLLYIKTKLQTTTEAKIYGSQLINNPHYKSYLEYAYLLRNYAELCDETHTCIELYNKALKIFHQHSMNHDMASIYISMSMIAAYEGKILLSKKYLEYAQKLDRRDLSLCYILNNSSVLCLLDGTYDEMTEKDLKNALLLSESRYEKNIVQCNLLIYYCLTKNFKKAEIIAHEIEFSGYKDFNYEEFLHIIYQNLYFFYLTFGHKKNKQNYYFDQILALIKNPNTRASTRVLASGMNKLVECKKFYAQFKYRADFLGYWEFTIDNDLDH